MTIYQWLCLLGAPAMIGGGFSFIIRRIRQNIRQAEALEKGVQALLRAQMVAEYNRCAAQGFAPVYARENFENCWIQYHALGGNGVMDDMRGKFMALDTGKENDK